MLPTLVYFLCFATSVTCTVLLARGYARRKASLLLWSALCFGCLSVNNLLLVLDLSFLPNIDLRPERTLTALLAVSLLLVGFIFKAD